MEYEDDMPALCEHCPKGDRCYSVAQRTAKAGQPVELCAMHRDEWDAAEEGTHG